MTNPAATSAPKYDRMSKSAFYRKEKQEAAGKPVSRIVPYLAI